MTALRVPLGTRAAARVGATAATISRLAKVGAGGTIGGRVTLALRRSALTDLAAGRTIAMVTGTNGKTTTTTMLALAVGALGAVAHNVDGANLPAGLVTALGRSRRAPYAVLETDEVYVPQVLDSVSARLLVLLNLSRDQMDRVGEVRGTERLLRQALDGRSGLAVVANTSDPLVVSAAQGAAEVVWVDVPMAWREDAVSCPRCGDVIADLDGDWRCQCGLARPTAAWRVEGDVLVTPDDTRLQVHLNLPGPANVGNAAMAAAAADVLGVSAATTLERVGGLSHVAGRYRRTDFQGRQVRMLLAKNPAGWSETLRVLDEHEDPVLLSVNSQAADGRDMSWLWDVPFENLGSRHVVVMGERGTDLAVRLSYAGVPHDLVRDPLDAVRSVPPGPVEVIANYTAFRELDRRLNHGA